MRKPIPINAALHKKPYFLLTDVLQRWSFQKNWAGKWYFLSYQKRWYFFFPKIWPYPLDGKWKMIFLKKTRKYNMFFKRSEKMVFSKRGALGHDLSCIIWKDGIFFPENIFFPWAESERWSFSRSTRKYDIFCVHVRVLQLRRHALLSKIDRRLDWYSRKSSRSSLDFHGDLYRHFHALQQEKPGNLLDRIEVWLLL